MKIEWKQIAEGIGNSLFIKNEVEKIANERIALCQLCPHYSPNIVAAGGQVKFPYAHCNLCKCNMYLKTRALSAYCPDIPRKWNSITDNEIAEALMKSDELKNQLDEYKRELHAKKINDHGSI